MKKLISLMMIALLSLGANVSAQEEAEAGAATDSVSGFISENKVVIGAVAVGVAAAIIANNDDDGVSCSIDEVLVNGACVCPAGQVKFNGTCTTQELRCDEGGSLVGDLCVIPPGTVVNGTTITVTQTYVPTLFP